MLLKDSFVDSMDRMFDNTNLSSDNYDNLLNDWSQLTLQRDVKFGASNLQFSLASAVARQNIFETYNWQIIDAGPL